MLLVLLVNSCIGNPITVIMETSIFESDSEPGAFNNIVEVNIDFDGIHIVTQQNKMIDFYFDPPRHDSLGKFCHALTIMYDECPDILHIN